MILDSGFLVWRRKLPLSSSSSSSRLLMSSGDPSSESESNSYSDFRCLGFKGFLRFGSNDCKSAVVILFCFLLGFLAGCLGGDIWVDGSARKFVSCVATGRNGNGLLLTGSARVSLNILSTLGSSKSSIA